MAEEAAKSNAPRWVMTVIVIILVAVIGVSYSNWLRGMVAEKTKNKANALFTMEAKEEDHVEVAASIVNIDPGKGEMQVRLECGLNGKLLDEDGGGAAIPIQVTVNSISGRSEHNYKKKEMVGPVDFVTGIEGTSFSYPDDAFKGAIEVGVFTPVYEDEKPAKDATPSSFDAVPMDIEGYSKTGGFVVTKGALEDVYQKGTKEYDSGEFRVVVKMERNPLIKMFANLIMFLQWMLASAAFIVTFVVVVWGRKPELAMFTWMTAMLFALPPMRNIMVGAPPIGIRIDFQGFLCCEGIVALCLCSLVLTWIIRK